MQALQSREVEQCVPLTTVDQKDFRFQYRLRQTTQQPYQQAASDVIATLGEKRGSQRPLLRQTQRQTTQQPYQQAASDVIATLDEKRGSQRPLLRQTQRQTMQQPCLQAASDVIATLGEKRGSRHFLLFPPQQHWPYPRAERHKHATSGEQTDFQLRFLQQEAWASAAK